MVDCDECGDETNMPYNCRFCGGKYCSTHRLPENHACDGLSSYKRSLRDEGRMYDYPSEEAGRSGGLRSKVMRSIPLGGLRGNVTYLLLSLMVVTFLLQAFVRVAFPNNQEIYVALFLLSSTHITYVWTWFTSIFAHGGLTHIFFNGIVLYFFGTVTERRIGSKRFLVLFLVAGVVAGLAQTVAALLLTNEPSAVLGASGAIMAVMGVLTVLNPNLRVYLWFILPMPLWVITVLFAGYDLFLASTGGVGAGGVARLAHLSGLALGLLYGWKLKQEGVSVGRQLRLSGPGGPGGGGRRPPKF